MPAGQNVAFEPPLDGVLAEHLHDATASCKLPAIGIFREVLAEPHLLTNFIDGLKLVGLCFIWPKNPEVVHVLPRHFPEELPEGGNTTGHGSTGFLDFNAGSAEIRHLQWLS